MKNNDLISFHVLFDYDLHKDLMKHARKLQMKFSEFINEVLLDTMFLIDKVDFWNGKLPEQFDENDLEITVDRTIYISREVKYKLFHFQNHFKLRSKAAVMRFILRVYLEKLEVYGAENVERMRRIMYNKWQKSLKLVGVWRKEFFSELEKNTHMGEFYQCQWVELVNSLSLTTSIMLL